MPRKPRIPSEIFIFDFDAGTVELQDSNLPPIKVPKKRMSLTEIYTLIRRYRSAAELFIDHGPVTATEPPKAVSEAAP